MANTIQYYQTQITEAYVANAAAVGIIINPAAWSVANIDRCFIYAVAVCAWSVNTLFDFFTADVNATIAAMKPHSLQWYAGMARAFQLGQNLVAEADYYDNTGLDADVVAASKIVAYAAVVEQTRGVRIKVAKTMGTDLGPLLPGELTAFSDYMKKVKDAGVKLSITSAVADDLRLVITVKYNPLVLTSTGSRIDGITATPVKDAIKAFLKNLPFNGVFSIQKLVDAIQAVEGVDDLTINEAQTRYGLLVFSTVNMVVVPDAGYLRIADGDLVVSYV